jgi:hypothetical protein
MAIMWDLANAGRHDIAGQFQRGFEGGKKQFNEREKRMIMSEIANNPGMDLNEAAMRVLAVDPATGGALLQAGMRKDDQTFRQSQAAADRAHQERVFTAQQAHQARMAGIAESAQNREQLKFIGNPDTGVEDVPVLFNPRNGTIRMGEIAGRPPMQNPGPPQQVPGVAPAPGGFSGSVMDAFPQRPSGPAVQPVSQMAQQPSQMEPQPTPQFQIPPPPRGTDPKKWRELMTKDAAARAKAAAAGGDSIESQRGIVLEDIRRARGLLRGGELTDPKTGKERPLSISRLDPAAGFGAETMRDWIGGSNAAQMEEFTETIRSSIGFDRLQRMREESPTGGALGSIAVQELKALQATLGSLAIRQKPAELDRNLKRLETLWSAVERKAGAYPNAAKYGFGGGAAPGPENPVRPRTETNASATGTTPAKAQPALKPGHIEDGYRFRGGNPALPSSWEKM